MKKKDEYMKKYEKMKRKKKTRARGLTPRPAHICHIYLKGPP